MTDPTSAPTQSIRLPDTADLPLARLVEVTPGQTLQATVLARLDEGKVLLGLLGGKVEASTSLPLDVGSTYELQVTATSPSIVLTAARSPLLPDPAQLATLLGPGAKELQLLLGAFLEPLGADSSAVPAGALSGRRALEQLLVRWRDGTLQGADVAIMQRTLGHEQEARVLRLLAHDEGGELRASLKAQALEALADGTGGEVARAARHLVQGLNQVEAENARRAEQGAPLWLPLPVPQGGELQDARMFVAMRKDSEARAGSPSPSPSPFTIVLLLDFTRLGPLRVDIHVRGDEIDATFQAVELGTVDGLRHALPELRAALDAQGLCSRSLEARRAAGARLPVADLILPDVDPRAMVDVHA